VNAEQAAASPFPSAPRPGRETLAPLQPPDVAPLTLAGIKRQDFPPASPLHRGLDENAVRVFRDQVAVVVRDLTEEIHRLRQQVAATHPRPQGGEALQEPGVHGARILARAQQTAERTMADADHYRAELIQQARTEADQIITEARLVTAQITASAGSAARDLRSFHRGQLEALDRWDGVINSSGPPVSVGGPEQEADAA